MSQAGSGLEELPVGLLGNRYIFYSVKEEGGRHWSGRHVHHAFGVHNLSCPSWSLHGDPACPLAAGAYCPRLWPPLHPRPGSVGDSAAAFLAHPLTSHRHWVVPAPCDISSPWLEGASASAESALLTSLHPAGRLQPCPLLRIDCCEPGSLRDHSASLTHSQMEAQSPCWPSKPQALLVSAPATAAESLRAFCAETANRLKNGYFEREKLEWAVFWERFVGLISYDLAASTQGTGVMCLRGNLSFEFSVPQERRSPASTTLRQ